MNILERASERVVDLNTQMREINSLMREVEKNDKYVGLIKELEVAMTDRKTTTYLTDILSEEEMQHINATVIDIVTSKGELARTKLESLLPGRKPAVPNPVFEEAVKEMESQPKRAFGAATELTDEDIKSIVEMYQNNAKIQELATKFRIGKERVTNILKEHEALRGKGRVCDIDYDKAAQLYREGAAIQDIADELGCNKSSLYNYFRENSINRPSKKDVEYIGKNAAKKTKN